MRRKTSTRKIRSIENYPHTNGRIVEISGEVNLFYIRNG